MRLVNETFADLLSSSKSSSKYCAVSRRKSVSAQPSFESVTRGSSGILKYGGSSRRTGERISSRSNRKCLR